MTTAAPSTALATIQPAFTDPGRLALAGFLAGYRGPVARSKKCVRRCPAGDRSGRADALSPDFSARCGPGRAGQPVRPMTA